MDKVIQILRDEDGKLMVLTDTGKIYVRRFTVDDGFTWVEIEGPRFQTLGPDEGD